MNPGMLAGIGVLFCLVAALLLLMVVFKPRHGRISLSRILQPGELTDVTKQAGTLARATHIAVEAINRVLDRRGSRYTMATTLELAGIKMRPADFIIWVSAATGTAVLAFFLLEIPAASFFMVVLVPLLAWAFVRILTNRREALFAEQLGGTLQLLSGGMRAGHSLMHAISAAANDSDAPMSEELSRVVNQARLGRDTGESLLATAARMNSEDFGWVAQAIEINREAGGDLAEVLDHVGDTIRDRDQIRRQVQALSAEGRMSALVLLGLPIFVAVALSLINPGYFSPLFASPIGILLVFACLALMALGGVWLRSVIKIKF